MEIQKDSLNEEFAHKYIATMPQAEFDDNFEKKLTEIAPKIKMDGFRDGNVPIKVIREKHGEQIKREMLANVAQNAIKQILDENENIRPIGAPRVNFLPNENDNIKLEVNIFTAPDIEVKDFSHMVIKRPQVDIPDNTIQENLTNLARRTAPVEEVKRKSKENDVIVIDYEGIVSDNKENTIKAKDFRIGLGDKAMLPEFEKNLENLEVGDKKNFDVTFPDTHSAKNIAGQKVNFSIEVKKILERKKENFSVNDELAKRLKQDNLNNLKNVVVAQIQNSLLPVIRQIVKRQIFDWFDKQYSFPLPQRLIDAEFSDIWKRVQNEMSKRNVEKDKFPDAEEKLRTQYRAIAERRLKTGLILADIARRNGIAVNDAELLNSIKARIGNRPNQQQQQLLARIDKRPQSVLAEFRPQALEENVVEYILNKVSIENEKIELDDMIKRAQELKKETQLQLGDAQENNDSSIENKQNSAAAIQHQGKKNKKRWRN